MFGGDFMDRSKKVLKKRKQDLSIPKFQELFNTEQACHDYLFKLKWPNGFVCSKCEHNEYYFVKKNSLYQCKCCKKQHSVTAGTLFHSSHVSLRQWFWAIYLISRDKRGYSAVALKNALNVSYPTAWLMLQKIRTAMANKDEDYILSGIIIIDDAFFG
ncbi:MAG TPA: IS1595 family transposase, partial [Firmicutes bacterium]|nr:IS1595 family transposase [Bacillota bacterium]